MAHDADKYNAFADANHEAALAAVEAEFKKNAAFGKVEKEKIETTVSSDGKTKNVSMVLHTDLAEKDSLGAVELAMNTMKGLTDKSPKLKEHLNAETRQQHQEWAHKKAESFAARKLIDEAVVEWGGFKPTKNGDYPNYKRGHALEARKKAQAVEFEINQYNYDSQGLNETEKAAKKAGASLAIENVEKLGKPRIIEGLVKRLAKDSQKLLGEVMTEEQIRKEIKDYHINITIDEGEYGKTLRATIESDLQHKAVADPKTAADPQALEKSNLLSRVKLEDLGKILARSVLFDNAKPIPGFAAIAGSDDIKALFKRMEKWVAKMPASAQKDALAQEVDTFLKDPMFSQDRWGSVEPDTKKDTLVITKDSGKGELHINFSLGKDAAREVIDTLAVMAPSPQTTVLAQPAAQTAPAAPVAPVMAQAPAAPPQPDQSTIGRLVEDALNTVKGVIPGQSVPPTQPLSQATVPSSIVAQNAAINNGVPIQQYATPPGF